MVGWGRLSGSEKVKAPCCSGSRVQTSNYPCTKAAGDPQHRGCHQIVLQSFGLPRNALSDTQTIIFPVSNSFWVFLSKLSTGPPEMGVRVQAY